MSQLSYRKKRYITYAILTLFIFITPFITINGNHLLLLSFVKMEFHFLGTAYAIQELYIMPFLLMILFIGILATTAIGGRIWCGWACPQTIFRVIYRDLIESKLLNLRRIKDKQKEIDYSKPINQVKKLLGISIFSTLCIIMASNFMWYFVPPEDFFPALLNPLDHYYLYMFIISITLFLVYDIVFTKEHFCTYICPYSRIQTVLYDDNTIQAVYNKNRGGHIYNSNNEKSILNVKQWENSEECTTCESCVSVCPTHIDIRKGMQLECINCLECVDACTTVMGRLGKPSLVTWSSDNEIHHNKKRVLASRNNILYGLVISLCIAFIILFSGQKEPLLINVNKTTQLYKIEPNKSVVNNYTVLLQNRQTQPYSFTAKVVDEENFEIKRFNSIRLNPDQQRRTVLLIRAKNRLFISDKKDSALKIKVIFYAKENPTIQLEKEIAFIYPRNALLK